MSRGRLPLRERLRRDFPELSKDALFSLLLSGDVRVDGEVCRDGTQLVAPASRVTAAAAAPRRGGRGRHKLAAAIAAWGLPVEGRVWLDAGASSGGFTAFLLQHGAGAVHAVDVGYNQLDYALRIDSRVHVWERCNIMETREYLPQPDLFCMDLSFRSSMAPIQTVLPLCREQRGVVLLKPQFEWRDPPQWFDGVVPDTAVEQVLSDSLSEWQSAGIVVQATLPSPIRGRRGNQEYLVYVSAV